MNVKTPVAVGPDCISILQVTDTHLMADVDGTLLGVNTGHYFEAILRAACTTHSRFDLILLTGDLSQDASVESYERIQNRMQALNAPCLCMPGNHDDHGRMRRLFVLPGVVYQRELNIGLWKIITLNSQIPGDAGGHLADDELVALEQCLNRKDETAFTLIAVHHHCVPTGSMWMDSMIINNRREFLDVLKRHSTVKGVVSGHIHQELDTYLGSIRMMGTPSTCFQFTPKTTVFSVDSTPPGYRTIHLYSDGRIESEVFRLPGKLTELERDSGGY